MAARTLAAPLPVILLILSFLVPSELSLYLAGLRLPPHRVAVILLLPFAFYRLAAQRGMRLHAYDGLFLLYGWWTIFAYWLHSGMEGAVFGGSVALESFGTYVVARAYVRTRDAMLSSVKVMLAAVAVAAAFALPETLLGQIFTHDFLQRLLGLPSTTIVEHRLHLTRAYSAFDHPIHYGSFCASMLALAWYANSRAWTRAQRIALISGATMLSLSSAPLLSAALQAALIVWEMATRGISGRTSITVALVLGLFFGVSLVATRSPFTIVATGFTLDPWTGYYRLQIWLHGFDSVLNNLWTGIGLAELERPEWMFSSTVDAYWLVTTMRTGLPSLVLQVLAIALLVRGVVKAQRRLWDRECRRIATGWLISLIALILIGVTVHYWNVVHAYMFFFLGLGGWLADPKRNAQGLRTRHNRTQPPQPAHEPVPVYTYPGSGTVPA